MFQLKMVFKTTMLFLIFCILQLSQSAEIKVLENCECGVANLRKSPNARIVGGKEVSKHAYPWVVGLLEYSNDKEPFCGGVLISNVHILTAAHCLVGVKPRAVILGDHDSTTNSDGKSYIESVRFYMNQNDVIHKNYNDGAKSGFPEFDIGIIELRTPFKFGQSNATVMPICLPDPNLNTDSDGSGKPLKATVAGWGRIGYDKDQSNVLRSVELDVLKNEDCDKMFASKTRRITRNHLCAYGRGKDACQGDSGGALFATVSRKKSSEDEQRQEAIGIVSFGDKCGTPNKPGGYTRVSRFVNWIVDKMKDTRTTEVEVCTGTLGSWAKLV